MKTSSLAAAFWAAILTASLPAQAEAYTPAQRVIKNPGAFPACGTKDRLPVRYIYERDESAGPAYATIDVNPVTGKEEGYIVYAPSFKRLSRQEQNLIAAHECAHLEKGHLKAHLARLFSVTSRIMEMDADCDAVRTLKRKGISRRDFERALFMFARYPEEDREHPNGAVRAAHARRCFDSAPVNGR